VAGPQHPRLHLDRREEARVKIESSKNEAGERVYRITK
jgi:hypothetical protein